MMASRCLLSVVVSVSMVVMTNKCSTPLLPLLELIKYDIYTYTY